jgi:uncharacterized phage protein gp47/JayE
VSVQTPTTAEINAAIIAQLETDLGQTIPILPKAFIRVLSKTLAGMITLLYRLGNFNLLQQFVSQASDQETTINGITITPLEEWGQLIGIGLPVAATRAEYTAEFTVTLQAGQIDSGTALYFSDSGVTYITIGAILLDAPTVQGTIRASGDQDGNGGRGDIGNLLIGDTVSFVSPVPNVENDAEIITELVRGVDQESTEAYRQRIIDRFQKVPQGGAPADYEIWGEEVLGIINVYPYKGDPGVVLVFCEATPESSGDPDGIPTAAQLEEVEESIELDDDGLASRRPVGAYVVVDAITRTPFDVTVHGLALEEGDLQVVKDDIETGLTEYFLAAEPFIAGLTIPPRKDRITDSAVAGAVSDITNARGATFIGVTLEANGSPTQIYPLGMGEKAKLGTVTYV